MAFSPLALLEVLHRLPPARRYWLGFSGGVDSHVLLHALSRVRSQLAVDELLAIHINHALQSQADQWQAHCQQVCADLGVTFHAFTVDAHAAEGESPEARARQARYQAWQTLLQPGDVLMTGHHQDDQAETLLLQLLRGAGSAGLSAMPFYAPLAAGGLARPLLNFTRQELVDYAREQGLCWIEDPSNQDDRFARNFLRNQVMPLLRQRWPSVSATLARAAQLQRESQSINEELARLDLQPAQRAQDCLSVSALLQYSDERVRNVLRQWIRRRGLSMPAQAILLRVQREVLLAVSDAMPVVHWRGGEIRRYRDNLYLSTPLPPHDSTACIAWPDPEREVAIDGVGTVHCRVSTGGGVSRKALAAAPLTIRFRQGGERIRIQGREGSHSIKNLLQEVGVVPWLRGRIPLVYCGDHLVVVVGYWISAEFCAAADEPAWVFETTP